MYYKLFSCFKLQSSFARLDDPNRLGKSRRRRGKASNRRENQEVQRNCRVAKFAYLIAVDDDVSRDQILLASYCEGQLERLRNVTKRYDPKGPFHIFQGWGFLLSKACLSFAYDN